MSPLAIEILSPKGQVLKGKAQQVVAPSQMGELGILPGHRALAANLVSGDLQVYFDEGVKKYKIGKGFIEVNDDHVVVLSANVEAQS